MPKHSAWVAETFSSGVGVVIVSPSPSRKPDRESTSSKSPTKTRTAAPWPRSRIAHVEFNKRISSFHTVKFVEAGTPSSPGQRSRVRRWRIRSKRRQRAGIDAIYRHAGDPGRPAPIQCQEAGSYLIFELAEPSLAHTIDIKSVYAVPEVQQTTRRIFCGFEGDARSAES
jgi:hypothetical protein